MNLKKNIFKKLVSKRTVFFSLVAGAASGVAVTTTIVLLSGNEGEQVKTPSTLDREISIMQRKVVARDNGGTISGHETQREILLNEVRGEFRRITDLHLTGNVNTSLPAVSNLIVTNLNQFGLNTLVLDNGKFIYRIYHSEVERTGSFLLTVRIYARADESVFSDTFSIRFFAKISTTNDAGETGPSSPSSLTGAYIGAGLGGAVVVVGGTYLGHLAIKRLIAHFKTPSPSSAPGDIALNQLGQVRTGTVTGEVDGVGVASAIQRNPAVQWRGMNWPAGVRPVLQRGTSELSDGKTTGLKLKVRSSVASGTTLSGQGETLDLGHEIGESSPDGLLGDGEIPGISEGPELFPEANVNLEDDVFNTLADKVPSVFEHSPAQVVDSTQGRLYDSGFDFSSVSGETVTDLAHGAKGDLTDGILSKAPVLSPEQAAPIVEHLAGENPGALIGEFVSAETSGRTLTEFGAENVGRLLVRAGERGVEVATDLVAATMADLSTEDIFGEAVIGFFEHLL